MKRNVLILLTTVLCLGGCVYDAPLTTARNLPIAPEILGPWASLNKKGEVDEESHRLMVLKYSESEYLVHYPTGENGIYYRAYPIKVGGVSCVQLQAIGTEKSVLREEEEEDNLFHVASYQLEHEVLEIKVLNKALVDDDLTGTEALKKAFLKNKDHDDLFKNPGKFRKIDD